MMNGMEAVVDWSKYYPGIFLEELWKPEQPHSGQSVSRESFELSTIRIRIYIGISTPTRRVSS
jgi:hypothetical protein